MFTTLTSDSAAGDLSDQPSMPWLVLDHTEPGLHLTDQGLEMTSAWSFPVGSTLNVGISGLVPGEADSYDDLLIDLEVLDSLDDQEETAAAAPDPVAVPRKAAVQAIGIVISCVPSPKEGAYQLTIYFLDHLANMIIHQDQAACDFVDEPSAAGLLPLQPPKLIPGKITHGPASGLFGISPEKSAPAAAMGAMPFFLGA